MDVSTNYMLLVLLPCACAIIVGFSFMEKRRRFKVECCRRLPEPTIPVNLLDNYNNRFGYCLGFGVLTSSFVSLIIFPSTYKTDYSNLNILITIFWASLYGIISYPLFYCQQPSHKAVGTIVGLFYCVLWLSLLINSLITFLRTARDKKTLFFRWLMVVLPELLCLLLLAIRFLVICIKAIKVCDNKGLKWRIKKLLYVWKPEFRYSTRIACTFFICYASTYLFFFMFLLWPVDILYILNKDIHHFYMYIFSKDIWYASVVLTTLRSCLVLFHMMCCYKLLKITQCNANVCNRKLDLILGLVRGSMRYSGLQFAFSIFGWLSAFFVISTFLFILRVASPDLFRKYWSYLLIMICLFTIQYLSVKFFFVQERGRILALDNRSAYHIFAYFFFFYNIFIGLFTSLKRMLYTLFVNMLMMENLQWTTLPGSFQRLDNGYRAYLGYLLSENAHANPLMRTFLFCLEDCLANEREEGKDPDPEQPTTTKWKTFSNVVFAKDRERKTWTTIRNRWQLALFLHRNPSLIAFRKHHLCVVKTEVNANA
eukprot:gene7310-8128_t